QFDVVGELLRQRAELGQRLVEPRALAHDLLRGLGIVPEIGSLRLGVQLAEALFGIVDVKENSSAALMTARSLRRWFGFQHAWVRLISREARGQYSPRTVVDA